MGCSPVDGMLKLCWGVSPPAVLLTLMVSAMLVCCVALCCAGLSRSQSSLFDGRVEHWLEMVSTNILGTAMITRAALQVGDWVDVQ